MFRACLDRSCNRQSLSVRTHLAESRLASELAGFLKVDFLPFISAVIRFQARLLHRRFVEHHGRQRVPSHLPRGLSSPLRHFRHSRQAQCAAGLDLSPSRLLEWSCRDTHKHQVSVVLVKRCGKETRLGLASEPDAISVAMTRRTARRRDGIPWRGRDLRSRRMDTTLRERSPQALEANPAESSSQIVGSGGGGACGSRVGGSAPGRNVASHRCIENVVARVCIETSRTHITTLLPRHGGLWHAGLGRPGFCIAEGRRWESDAVRLVGRRRRRAGSVHRVRLKRLLLSRSALVRAWEGDDNVWACSRSALSSWKVVRSFPLLTPR